jgi:hypothetical protein
MCHIRWITKLFLFLVIGQVVDRPAICGGEPVQLGQLYHSGTWFDDEPSQPFRFSFTVYLGPGQPVELLRMPTIADVGQTFAADPITLTKFNTVLTDDVISHTFDSGFGQPVPFHAQVDEFFDGPFMGEIPPTHSPDNPAIVMKAFVPQLGPNFSGYAITRVDQTIHGFNIDQPGGPNTFYRYWGAQTVRIYGERIPEPDIYLLVALGLIGFSWRQNRLILGLSNDCS